MNIVINIRLRQHYDDMNRMKSQQGMAAIFTVLVIGAASLILARSAAFLSMLSLDTSFIIDKEREAEYLAESCIEESLRRIQFDNNYAVTDLIWMQDANSCQITVVGSGPERIIEATGVIGDYNKSITAELSINNDQIIINKWKPNE